MASISAYGSRPKYNCALDLLPFATGTCTVGVGVRWSGGTVSYCRVVHESSETSAIGTIWVRWDMAARRSMGDGRLGVS